MTARHSTMRINTTQWMKVRNENFIHKMNENCQFFLLAGGKLSIMWYDVIIDSPAHEKIKANIFPMSRQRCLLSCGKLTCTEPPSGMSILRSLVSLCFLLTFVGCSWSCGKVKVWFYHEICWFKLFQALGTVDLTLNH